MFNKLMFSLLIAFCSANAFAGSVKLQVQPAAPRVYDFDMTIYPGTEDERELSANWYMSEFIITNNRSEAIILTGLKFETTLKSADRSFVGRKKIKLPAIEIPPGSTYNTGLIYSNNLSRWRNIVKYYVNVKLIGWVGSLDIPVDRLDAEVSFKTQ